jgi:hypothetical protein
MEESYMKDKSIPGVISRSLPYFLFILIFFFQLNTGQTQVEIKERVVIHPGGTSTDDPYGVISGDPNNPVYLRYGGEVIMMLLSHYNQTTAWHDTRLGEDSLGEIARYKDQFEEVNVGPFSQWQKLQFWVSDSIKLPDMERETVYPSSYSNEIVDDISGFLFFLLPLAHPGDTVGREMAWGIEVDKNDSLAAMPPPEILDYFGNPYVPSQEIIIPADGIVFMTIERVYSDVLVDLYQDVPNNQLLLSDLESREWETIDFGRKSAGDSLRFYIRSGHTLVNGMDLYPETYDNEYLSYYDGSVLFKDIWFEDWTDLLFNDIYCSLYLIPDNLADFPWSLDVELSPSVIAPGDTAQVILKWRNPDGSLEDFPDTLLFDVEVLSGYEYGDLYSPMIPYTFDYNFGIPQGFSFIAEDSIDMDSVWVSIWVGSSGGISSAVSQRKPSEIAKQQFEEVKTKNLVNKNKPTARGEPLIKLGNYPPFFMGIGEVLITKKDSLDHFELRILPDVLASQDTIAYTEKAKLIVQAKDVNDQDIEIPDSTSIKFSITNNDNYVTFLNPNGDTVKTTPVVLENVLYQDANSGKVNLAAVKLNPDSSVNCQVRVQLQSDSSINGEQTAIVLEQTLKIEMEDPLELWPTIPSVPIDSSKKQFKVKMTRGGLPVDGHRFKLKSDYIIGSGGHNHDCTPTVRRPDNNDNYGYFVEKGKNEAFRPLEDTTQIGGIFEVTFFSSIFGDTMMILLESMENKLLKDTLKIVEKVPGLELLPESVSYSKIGGTCNHHGPSDNPNVPDSCRTPDNNHWGTQSTIAAIDTISIIYRNMFPNDPKLNINDMSLIYGGRFDINGKWSGSTHHQYHRLGIDADIRSWSIPKGDDFADTNGNGDYDLGEPITNDINGNGVYDRNRESFNNICIDHGVNEVLFEQNPEHYHLFFWNRNE